MYQFNDGFNYKARFWWEKKLIHNNNWAMLPKNSKAIYPVICSYINEKGVAFPGERTIAILSGISDKYVREGIRGLDGFPGFNWRTYITKRGKQSKKFYINLPQENFRDSFPFHRNLLESGIWRELKPTAKALYPVMRAYGYFDINEYAGIENLEVDETDFNEVYPYREYDLCEAERNLLVEAAGINRRSFNNAIEDLRFKCLLLDIEQEKRWKVFLRPYKHYSREYLNKKIMKSYSYELRY